MGTSLTITAEDQEESTKIAIGSDFGTRMNRKSTTETLVLEE